MLATLSGFTTHAPNPQRIAPAAPCCPAFNPNGNCTHRPVLLSPIPTGIAPTARCCSAQSQRGLHPPPGVAQSNPNGDCTHRPVLLGPQPQRGLHPPPRVARPSIPTGLNPIAQGWRTSAYPGFLPRIDNNPERVEAYSPKLLSPTPTGIAPAAPCCSAFNPNGVAIL
jgi:hypothetical protein